MKEKIEKRLQELQDEFALGQKMLAEAEAKETNLKTTLLRISGAVQELSDMLKDLEGKNTQEEAAVQ